MSDYPVTRGSRSGDPHPTLRLAALTAVIAGVVLVAAAAFLLSYEGIHQIALQAGVSATLARLYPLMFDAMLIVACAATLALRSAGWGSRLYVWACLLLVLAAVAAGDALHATGVRLNGQPARAAIAIIPWVLLLMGFGIWLVMLRHWRRVRAAGAATGTAASRAGAATGTEASRAGPAATGGAAAAGGTVSWAAGRGATPARAGASGSRIDGLMEPRAGQAPGRAPAADSPAAGKPDGGQEQRHGAAPDQKLPAPAGAAGKAGSAAAGPPAGAGQNGTATAGAAAGPAAKATGIGPGAAVAAAAAGAAGAAAVRAAGSARAGQDESRQDESRQDESRQDGNGEDATGKEAAGQGSTGEDAAGGKATAQEDTSKEDTSKDNGGKGNGGKGNGGKGNGEAEAGDRRTRLGGFREVPASTEDEEGSVKILPPKPTTPAQGAAPAKDDAAPGKDSGADEAGKPGGEADRAASAPQPLPAAALAPQFDRLRSSPTPPEDPDDRG
jgi:Protein of unknown function (DUF2637)